MTKLQIDEALALAIGYLPAQIRCTPQFGVQVVSKNVILTSAPWWRGFSHLDPDVIWPIAERFDAFPRWNDKSGLWLAGNFAEYRFSGDRCAATAVALAVIELHRKPSLKGGA